LNQAAAQRPVVVASVEAAKPAARASACRLRVLRVLACCAYLALASLVAFMGLAACLAIWNLDRPTGWSAGELLINYQGGFVRRGWFGQLCLHTGRPLWMATQIQKGMVAAFVTGSTAIVFLWKRPAAALAYVLLIALAPGGLLHLATAGGFAFLDRKEIWFYVVLVVLIGCARTLGLFRLSTAVVAGVLAAVMILHHEAFAVFCVPPLVCCYAAHLCVARSRAATIQMAAVMLPSLAAFAGVLLHAGDAGTVQAIMQSYEGTDATGVRGGIAAIGWTFDTSHALSVRVLREGSWLYWLAHFSAAVALAAVCLAFTPRNRVGAVLAWCVLIWHVVATGLLAVAGWDWGRWISMFTIGSALMLALVHVAAEHPVFAPPAGDGFPAVGDVGRDRRMSPRGVVFIVAIPALLLSTLSRMASYGPQAGNLTLATDMWTRLFDVFK